MHWKATLNNVCKYSTFLKGPSSQWEGSCLLFGKDCLFLVIESGTNLTTNPAYWNITFACINMQFYSIPPNIQYHTIPYNTGQLDEAYFCLGIQKLWPEQVLSTQQMTRFPTWSLTFKVIRPTFGTLYCYSLIQIFW